MTSARPDRWPLQPPDPAHWDVLAACWAVAASDPADACGDLDRHPAAAGG